ncbi:MAG: PAS domain-containing protein [Acidobacteria bacterium]|nr:PAS domain-containing protein [Acidobacteriota bacterium]
MIESHDQDRALLMAARTIETARSILARAAADGPFLEGVIRETVHAIRLDGMQGVLFGVDGSREYTRLFWHETWQEPKTRSAALHSGAGQFSVKKGDLDVDPDFEGVSVVVPMLGWSGDWLGLLVGYTGHPFTDTCLEVLQLLAAPCSQAVTNASNRSVLVEQEQRLARLISNLPGMVYRSKIDTRWTKEFISDGCLELTGYTAAEFMSDSVAFVDLLVDPAYREVNDHEALRAIQEKRPFLFEFAIRTRSGELKHVWEQGVPVFDEKGEAIAIEGYITDITELVTARGELQARSEELKLLVTERTRDLAERNQQLNAEIEGRIAIESELRAAKEFANAAIHNIRNVLNSINVSSYQMANILDESRLRVLKRCLSLLDSKRENLVDYVANDPKSGLLMDTLIQLAPILQSEQGLLAQEITALRRSVQLINDIATSQQSLAREFVDEGSDLSDIVKDALRIQMSAGLGQTIEVTAEIPAGMVVRGPSTKVGHVIMNLLKNAKEAMLSNNPDNRKLKLATREISPELVELSVEDNGAGMTQETLDRLFSYGFTTKADGHGFGLHYCARIAKDLGGDLVAHSDGLGLGSRFVLMLPRASS